MTVILFFWPCRKMAKRSDEDPVGINFGLSHENGREGSLL